MQMNNHSFSSLRRYSFPCYVSVILPFFSRLTRSFNSNLAILCPRSLRILHWSTLKSSPSRQTNVSASSSIFCMLSFVGRPSYLKYDSIPWPYASSASTPFCRNTVNVAFVPDLAKSGSRFKSKNVWTSFYVLFVKSIQTYPRIYLLNRCVLSALSSSGDLPSATYMTLFFPIKNLLSLIVFWIFLKGPVRMFSNERAKHLL